jgi:hypothetical protein
MPLPDISPFQTWISNFISTVGLVINSLVLSGGFVTLLVFLLKTRSDNQKERETREREHQKERETRERERIGLLRVIDIEVYLNKKKLTMLRESPDIGEQYRAFNEPHTAHWDDSRARLAQLLPADHFRVMSEYYGLLHEIAVNAGDEGKPLSQKEKKDRDTRESIAVRDAERKNLLVVLAREALQRDENIRQRAKLYIGDTPDYFGLYKNDEDKPLTTE